jgi:hypothetical protein
MTGILIAWLGSVTGPGVNNNFICNMRVNDTCSDFKIKLHYICVKF